MDRNSAIGLFLIGGLLLLYFNFFSPTPVPLEQQPAQITTTDSGNKDSLSGSSIKLPVTDSVKIKQYGNLSSFLGGTESTTRLENPDMIITLSNRGGVIKNLELKKYKTYGQQPLLLVAPENNSFSLTAMYEGKEIDLYSLYYTTESRKVGDTTLVSFVARISESAFIKHVYSIPPSGYKIRYKIESQGLSGLLAGEHLTFLWKDKIPLQEKDLQDSRVKTTVNYYLTNGEFDGLSQASLDNESDALADPIQWAAIRQKFFISSIIARSSFSGGEVSTSANVNDSLLVKTATVKLFIPKADVIGNKANFQYYFGPNDYEVLADVAPEFQLNLDLGFPPVNWINRFVIIPIFNFLERYISNYGLIIVLLVLFIKLLLTPLSYKSYMGMAKMKLLKPELDVLKEKNGDNMTQMQQDQMKLYQQAGVNPFSGCIPLLLQMPILFAMFYFFPVSIELRQQSFLWAEDLSTYDSILSLPFTIPFYGAHVSLFVLLMTASTLVTTWQNNQISTVTGPMKSMGYIMPVVFMFVLNSFSAGLSFYYFVSNLLGIAQQAIIRRFVDESKITALMEENKKKAASGTGTKSKFMTKLQDAMKASEEARRTNEAKRKK